MLRQSAFRESVPFLKGGLHCHTTRSDGLGTPEEVIRLHVENGYDFLAITDHRIYNLKNFTGLPITILPGMEIDSRIQDDMHCHVFHCVCLGDPATSPFRQDETVPSVPCRDQFDFQPQLDALHEKNQMTFYCHPEWSATPARDFMHLKGNFALEVWNTDCALGHRQDMNASCWDELLWEGQRVWGVATDDGHHMEHHCRGWVMVRAENRVPDILRALRDGAFYSTTGPLISDFCYDESTRAVQVKCSPARSIEFYSRGVPTRVIEAGETPLTEGGCVFPEKARYIRACVLDENGRRAWTNPIFLTD